MKILLLHPEDDIRGPWGRARWDSVVDLARAPRSLYDEWSEQLKCPVYSIFDLAHEVEDLWSLDSMIRLGLGRVVDRFGIDWWDVISLILYPELQDVRLAMLLADKLGTCQGITVSQPSVIAEALRVRLGCPLEVLQTGKRRLAGRTIGRYRRALTSLSFEHLRQVVYDKYDPQYVWRRRLAGRVERSSKPVVLLPSAYSNVTRTALSYAKVLPDQQFLLVLARESGAVSPVPPNVRTEVLAAFATEKCDKDELRVLENAWVEMEQSLRDHPDFNLSIQLGILEKARRWLRWGVTVRDAWRQVFEMNSVVGCLSADDSNPYTRIPLLLALRRGMPAIACHHGALDGRMAFKSHRFSKYLAKSEMEREYLTRVCRVDPSSIEIGPPSAPSEHGSLWTEDAPWIVFFSESYEADYWRVEAMYRELLPRLVATARRLRKKVVVKLHPFESLRQRQRIVKRVLTAADLEVVSLTDEPFSERILEKTWCAVTVESTVAFECAAVGIPVFLCGWLRHAYTGYAPQYAKFGVGHTLAAPDDLLKIGDALRPTLPADNLAQRLVHPITATSLSNVLCGTPADRLR